MGEADWEFSLKPSSEAGCSFLVLPFLFFAFIYIEVYIDIYFFFFL